MKNTGEAEQAASSWTPDPSWVTTIMVCGSTHISFIFNDITVTEESCPLHSTFYFVLFGPLPSLTQ